MMTAQSHQVSSALLWWCSKVTVLLLLLALWSSHCSAATTEFEPSAEEDETLRNVIRTEQYIVVGSSRQLYLIDPGSLSVEQSFPLSSANRLLVADVGGSYNGNVLSCDNDRCFLAEIADLQDVNWSLQPSTPLIRSGVENVAAVLSPSAGGMTDVILGEVATGAFPRRFVKGSFLNVDLTDSTTMAPQDSMFEKRAERAEISITESFEYYTQIAHNGFVYFVTSPVAGASLPTVIRFCQNDTGFDDSFSSHFELKLDCRAEDSTITAATFVMGGALNEPTILVSTARSTAGEMVDVNICGFTLSEVDRIMRAKFDNCIMMIGLTGFERSGLAIDSRRCPFISPERRPSAKICDVPGNLRQGLEVVPPLVKSPLITHSLPNNEHLTSLTTITLEGSLFLFAGSSKSRLHQFHIVSNSSILFTRAVPLNEAPGTNVTHLLPSNDGEHVFAMTPNKLLRHTVDQCHLLTDCSSCVTSNDPICGWCALSGTCVRSSQCNGVSDASRTLRRLFVQELGSCPRIDSSTPSIVHLEQLEQGDVQIDLATSNILNSVAQHFDYRCVFTFQDERGEPSEFPTDARVQSGDTFTCQSPGSEFIPPLPPMTDTVNASVSLRPVQTMTDFAVMEAPLGYTDCTIHTSCGNCISSGVDKCRWCPLSFACISDLATSQCPDNGETPITSGLTCQSILPHLNTTNYLLHSGHQYSSSPLLINSQQLNILQGGEFSCRICTNGSCAEVLASSTATFNSPTNTVQCNLDTFSYTRLSVDTPSVDFTLQVLYDSFVIDNPEDVKVTVYTCNFLGSNCAQCLSLDARYSCNYCSQRENMPGDCTFHSGEDSSPLCPASRMELISINQCDSPSIIDFTPKDGPTPGGTNVSIVGRNLGVDSSDIGRITIGDVACTMTSYRPGVGLDCRTGSMQANLVSDHIEVELNFQSDRVQSVDRFNYLAPSLDNPPATPQRGPASGGTTIVVTGRDLGIGSQRRVTIRQQTCSVVNHTMHSITCITPGNDGDPVLNNLLEVMIDDWSLEVNGYDYLADPTFMSISPNRSFYQGGTLYTVTGENLDNVVEPRLLLNVTMLQGEDTVKRQADETETNVVTILSEPCTTSGSSTMSMMVCEAPSLEGFVDELQLPVQVRVGLKMDGVTALLDVNTSVIIHHNPTINEFSSPLELNQGDRIILTIMGEGFLFTKEEVNVTISPCGCACLVSQVYSNNNSLLCEVMDSQVLPKDQDLEVILHLGSFSANVGTIRVISSISLLIILIPAFAGVAIVAVVIFIVLFAVFCRKTRQKDQRYDQLMMELERLESSVARECKLGFAELQTDLDELTGDVAGCRLPYHNLQSFFLATLFPDHKDHPILRPVESMLPSHQRGPALRALRDFGDLLNDRKVLLLFIQTLEEQRSFGIRDKSTVGSLLIVALHNRMDYATDVLKKLLTLLIRKTVANSIPKLLLRRTESIAERMLTNWLSFCLQGYIMEHAGQPMFMLYRAVKNQLEKGPVDVITGEARYSLSEQKLIRQKVDVVAISATVEAEDGLRVPVKLLDCDTISQAKEKLLDSMHKAAPVSKRPKLTEVDLEYLKSPSESMILRDEDHSTVVEGGWKRLNTLRHYWVQDGAMFRIRSRRDHAPPGRVYDYPGSIISTHSPRQRALSEAEDGTRVWHLFKQIEMEDPKRSPFLNKKMVSEIYLPRMLSTKSILQNFVDELFDSLFSTSHPPPSPTAASFPLSPGAQVPMGYAPGGDAVPMAVKYLFDFLDDAAEDCKIADSDVVHTWKNNALALRFWVNLIKNPEFVFDINKSHTVDACLSVVAQAFIDGCSTAETKLNIDSPTSKLLYNKEVQNYKTKVKKFYSDVKQMPRIPEDAMQYFLRQLSEYQSTQMKKTGGFVVDSAVNELLRYGIRYAEPFLLNLQNAGLPQRADQFKGVLKISRSSTLL